MLACTVLSAVCHVLLVSTPLSPATTLRASVHVIQGTLDPCVIKHAHWGTMGGSVPGCVVVPTTLRVIIKMGPATVILDGLGLTAPSVVLQGRMALVVVSAAFVMVSVIL